jgi:hypothetical protein
MFYRQMPRSVQRREPLLSNLKLIRASKSFKKPFKNAVDIYIVIFFWAKLVRNGRIRAVEVRPQKFRANFSQFG